MADAATSLQFVEWSDTASGVRGPPVGHHPLNQAGRPRPAPRAGRDRAWVAIRRVWLDHATSHRGRTTRRRSGSTLLRAGRDLARRSVHTRECRRPSRPCASIPPHGRSCTTLGCLTWPGPRRSWNARVLHLFSGVVTPGHAHSCARRSRAACPADRCWSETDAPWVRRGGGLPMAPAGCSTNRPRARRGARHLAPGAQPSWSGRNVRGSSAAGGTP